MRRLAVLLLSLLGCNGANRALERMVDQQKVSPATSAGRLPPDGVVDRDATLQRPDLTEGLVAGDRFPLLVTMPLLERGRNRFEIFCAPCHGVTGTADTPIAERMTERRPPSLHEPRLVALRPAQVYRVIHRGYGLMPSYDFQLSVEDRWAVTAYVKALQMSRGVPIVALPMSLREEASAALSR